MNCPLCRNQEPDCPICSTQRVGMLEREARKEEAIAWINKNLVQTIRGEEVVCMPQEQDDVIHLVMSIIRYAREPRSTEGSPEPMPCERFTRLEWRDPVTNSPP